VRSALDQSLGAVEVVIVDDGSTDDTPRVVEELERADPRVRGVRQANAGLAGARNTGLAQATAPWIAFLDDDDLWHDEALEQLLRFGEAHTGPAVASLAVAFGSGDPQIDAARVLANREAFGVTPLPPLPFGPIMRLEELVLRPLVPINAGLFRRDPLTAAGGFRPELRAAEDYDLWLRLTIDEPVPVLPEQLALVRRHPDQMSGSLLNMASSTRRVLEDLLAAHPELTRRLPRASLQRRLAFLAREEAYASLLEADSPRAARSAWRSIRYTPLAPKSWLYLALSPWPKLHARIRPHPK